MKVVLISGSPNKDGNTALLMQECAKVVEGHGVEAEVISFAGKKIQSCIGCNKCAEMGKCGLKDDLNEIIDKLRSAQALIVAAPVYFGTARGDVMSALQRIGYVSMNTDNFLHGMVGGPIAVARRGGHTSTLQEMLMFFLINDMIVPGSSYWNMVFGLHPGEALNDEEGVQTVRHFAENVAKLVKKLN
ncbi:MAG TPA: flavodoxin family protein [Candidatus Acidoferrales bacterium]|nr:flavodoxin family protein [Candidatus Acidoferrales bacterium]